jgi:hypothetical protein
VKHAGAFRSPIATWRHCDASDYADGHRVRALASIFWSIVTRFRLKAIGPRDPRPRREADLSTLELDPNLGVEAVAWNRLLGERQNVQVSTAIRQVRDVVHEKSGTAGELTAAFDAVPYGLVFVNDRMQVEHVNGAAAVLLQKERAQMVRAEISSIISDPGCWPRVTLYKPASKPGSTAEQGGSMTKGVPYTVCRSAARIAGLIAIEDITQRGGGGDEQPAGQGGAGPDERSPPVETPSGVSRTGPTGKNLAINEET